MKKLQTKKKNYKKKQKNAKTHIVEILFLLWLGQLAVMYLDVNETLSMHSVYLVDLRGIQQKVTCLACPVTIYYKNYGNRRKK